MSSLVALEVIWTIGALVGVCVSGYNLFDVLTDLRVLSRSKMNGLRSMVAKGNIRGEAVRLYILIAFLGIGVMSLALPNNPTDDANAVQWALRLGLMSVNAATVYNTIADRVLRYGIFNYADSVEERIVHLEEQQEMLHKEE